jgi:hypothetical protein
VEILIFLMFVLTLVNVLFSASFVDLNLFCCSCAKVGTSSIDWDQLSRSHQKTKTESILRNVVLNEKEHKNGCLETQIL